MTSQPSSSSSDQQLQTGQIPETSTGAADESQPSYIKLAMRNMVKKRQISLLHFGLTTIGLLAVLVGLAYLTR